MSNAEEIHRGTRGQHLNILSVSRARNSRGVTASELRSSDPRVVPYSPKNFDQDPSDIVNKETNDIMVVKLRKGQELKV